MRRLGLLMLLAVLLLATGTARAEVIDQRFPCIESYVEPIRSDPADKTREAFKACQDEITEAVPFARSRLKQKAVLTHVVSYEMAPYGKSNAVEFQDLLHTDSMNCGNYGYLAYWLHRAAWGRRQAKRYVQIGWEGGPVLNHAQTTVRGLLLDPTAGQIAAISYQSMLAGGSTTEIVNFNHRLEREPFTEDIVAFRQRAIDALLYGQYARDQVLYRWTIDSVF